MHLPFKAAANNQVDVETEIQEVVVTQEPTPSQLVAEVVVGELQGGDAATQETTSAEVVSEAPTQVEIAIGEFQGEDVVRQEPTLPEVIIGVPMQEVQDVQIGASDDKVWTQLPQNFVNLDSDNEYHAEDEGI